MVHNLLRNSRINVENVAVVAPTHIPHVEPAKKYYYFVVADLIKRDSGSIMAGELPPDAMSITVPLIVRVFTRDLVGFGNWIVGGSLINYFDCHRIITVRGRVLNNARLGGNADSSGK